MNAQIKQESTQTACLDVSQLQRYKNQKLSKFVTGFVYNGGKYYFKSSCTMSLFLIKEVFLCFNCIFVLSWKYNIKRNANLDFSIAELQLLFELGVKKISMQKF